MTSITLLRFSAFPVVKLSTTRTTCSSATRASTRCDPRKPAPPVTRQTVMLLLFGKSILRDTKVVQQLHVALSLQRMEGFFSQTKAVCLLHGSPGKEQVAIRHVRLGEMEVKRRFLGGLHHQPFQQLHGFLRLARSKEHQGLRAEQRRSGPRSANRLFHQSQRIRNVFLLAS